MTDLGADYEITALPAKFLDGLAHNNLGLASGVVLGRVEEVDTEIIRLLHTLKCLLILDVATKGQPSSEANGGNVEAGSTKPSVDHAGFAGFFPSHGVSLFSMTSLLEATEPGKRSE